MPLTGGAPGSLAASSLQVQGRAASESCGAGEGLAHCQRGDCKGPSLLHLGQKQLAAKRAFLLSAASLWSLAFLCRGGLPYYPGQRVTGLGVVA